MNEVVTVKLSSAQLMFARDLAKIVLQKPQCLIAYCTKKTRSGRRGELRAVASKLGLGLHTAQAMFVRSIPCLETVRQYLDRVLLMEEALNQKVTGNTVITDYTVPDLAKDEDSSLTAAVDHISVALFHALTGLLKYGKEGELSKCLALSGAWRFMYEKLASQRELLMHTTTIANTSVANTPAMANTTVATSNGGSITQVGAITSSYRLPASTQEPSEKPMSDIKIKTITFVNGKPINDYTDDEIYCVIRQAEEKITELNKIKNKPKKLVQDIEKRNEEIQQLVDYLDNK